MLGLMATEGEAAPAGAVLAHGSADAAVLGSRRLCRVPLCGVWCAEIMSRYYRG